MTVVTSKTTDVNAEQEDGQACTSAEDQCHRVNRSRTICLCSLFQVLQSSMISRRRGCAAIRRDDNLKFAHVRIAGCANNAGLRFSVVCRPAGSVRKPRPATVTLTQALKFLFKRGELLVGAVF